MQTVTSRDGTRIAYDRTGTGRPLVFVHGGWDGHAAWRLVLPMLAEQFTTWVWPAWLWPERSVPA
jgi:pimeloyl-ACP methyl ester carboxylesterase